MNFFQQTRACDLKTKLALRIKREMIKAIHTGIPGWADEPEEQKAMLAKYKHYGDQVSQKFNLMIQIKRKAVN